MNELREKIRNILNEIGHKGIPDINGVPQSCPICERGGKYDQATDQILALFPSEPKAKKCFYCPFIKVVNFNPDLELAMKVIDEQRAELSSLKAAEKKVSDAYLRIRKLVGSWDTNRGGENRFELTENKIKELIALKARMEVGEIGDVITTLHLGLTMEQKLKIENAIVKHLKGERV